jgi:hypothetical protein
MDSIFLIAPSFSVRARPHLRFEMNALGHFRRYFRSWMARMATEQLQRRQSERSLASDFTSMSMLKDWKWQSI